MKWCSFATMVLASVFTGHAVPEMPQKHFEPNWDSLRQYECPEWFRDAKFGIYAHWGVYSVPAPTGNSDWYSRRLYQPGHPNHLHHVKKYGATDVFGYKDLVPLFTAEKFDADEWADLYVRSGAQFAGPVGEHADGFSMWASEANPWNAADMGPQRDIVAELEQAIRKRGLKFMVSMHHSWNWGWYPTWQEGTDCADAANASLYGPKLPVSSRGVEIGGTWNPYAALPMPSEAFEDLWLKKVQEVVSGYLPDLLWFDNRMQMLSERSRQEMAAFYYNHAEKRSQSVAMTFKRPDFPLGTGTVDLERSRMSEIYPEPWLTDTSISRDTWSWTSDLRCYSTERLIGDLVDIVSKNGCMLLNIAPAPDGSISEEQRSRLLEMGRWLKVNGEAIYGSRPWLYYGEGPSKAKKGHLADRNFEGYSEQDIRFTTKGAVLYAIALKWPESKRVSIHRLGSASFNMPIQNVSLLGCDAQLDWKQSTDALEIRIPDVFHCESAPAFKVVY